MTKAEKYKKIRSLVKSHGEVVVYFKFKHPGGFRRRRIRDNGNCFMSEGCYDPNIMSYKDAEWCKYMMSCFVSEDGGPKSLSRTIKLMEAHDRGLVDPIVIKIGNKEIKL
jgi:hypothetical protein